MAGAARLIVLSGLPGVGKTSVADLVARRLAAVHLSIDVVEEAMLGCGPPAGWQAGVAAYESIRVMSELNLRLGRTVVADAVNDSEEVRQTWRRAAEGAGTDLLFVHLVVPDLREHQRRLAGRDRGLRHVGEPSWAQVLSRASAYAPWVDDHLELDAAVMPLEDLADAVVQASS